jgi:hypothetical protein
VGLVDDEKGEAALASEIGEGSTELREETGKAEGRVSLEGKQDLVVEGDDGEMGVREVDDGVEIAVEGMGEGAESSRLASTLCCTHSTAPTSPVMRAGRRSWRAKERRPWIS